jgi:hypothetical protein
MRRAVSRFCQRAVIYDHVQFAGKRLGDGQRKVEPPSGDQNDFDSTCGRFGNRQGVCRGYLGLAVEQRPVNIHGNQLYGHAIILSCPRDLRCGH